MARSKPEKAYTTAEVIEAFRTNRQEVLSGVYALHYPSVLHFVLQNNGSEDDANDLYQEAVLALWQNIRKDKFENDSKANIGGYLFQIAKYKWLDKLKSKQHRSTLRLVRDEQVEAAYEDEEASLHEERLDQLANLFKQLGDTCKSILKQFYYEKKSLDDIGTELGYDAATMRTKKYRCMMQLRKMHNDSN